MEWANRLAHGATRNQSAVPYGHQDELGLRQQRVEDSLLMREYQEGRRRAMPAEILPDAPRAAVRHEIYSR